MNVQLLKRENAKTKAGTCCGSQEDIIYNIYSVPEGCFLDPLLFNIFLCDSFFLFVKYVSFVSYADDKTISITVIDNTDQAI